MQNCKKYFSFSRLRFSLGCNTVQQRSAERKIVVQGDDRFAGLEKSVREITMFETSLSDFKPHTEECKNMPRRFTMKLYFHYISIVLRSTMQYRASFFLMVTGRFLLSFNGILGVYFMLSRFGQVKGYTFGEVFLCFSVIQMDFALAECIGGGFAGFASIVLQGEFDRILLRPHSTILQVPD